MVRLRESGGTAVIRRLLVLLLLLGLAVNAASSDLVAPTAAQATNDAPVRLPGHTIAALARANRLAETSQAATATDQPLTITVVLNRADEAGFQRFLADVEDPKSANHGKFISQTELTKRFGPSQQAYDDVLGFLQKQGFVVTEGSANRLTLTVRGTRGQAEKAFAIQIGDYQLGARHFYANDQDPAVPASIAKHIQAVVGLSNLAQPESNRETATWVKKKCAGDPAVAAFCALAIRGGIVLLTLSCTTVLTVGCAIVALIVAFVFGLFVGIGLDSLFSSSQGVMGQSSRNSRTPRSLSGAGQKIGLLEYDTFTRSDVSNWLTFLQHPAAQINQEMALLSARPVNGGVAAPGLGESEVLLDIDMIQGAAPGANIVVYDAPGTTSFQTLFNAMVNDGDTVISNSWSYCEDQTSLADAQSIDAIFANASASGVSVINASGDSGSTCLDGSPNTVGVPADAPHATAVGGTTVTLGTGVTYGGEKWWDGSHASPPTGQGGFGTSRFFPRPAYQNGLTSATMRSVPDVVAPADPQNGLSICQADAGGCPNDSLQGGTSMAAPEWAATAALLNEFQGHNVGNLNPLLYPLANTGSFHTPASMGSDFAHVGLGSPILDRINLALAGKVAGPVNAAASQVAPLPNAAPADGTTTVPVQVNLLDANGHFVSGKNVALSAASGAHSMIAAASGPSSVNDGSVTFLVSDSTVESVVYTATDTTDGVVLAQTATVYFLSPAATAGGVVANPPTVPADGTTASTITITLHDANGNGVSGKTVTLAQGNGHSIINGPTPATTNGSGQVTFAATDIQTETVTYTAVDVTDGNLPVPGSATVSFTSGSVTCDNGTATAAPGYAFTPFATGFNSPGGCGGPTGVAFDSAGNLYAVNIRTGLLYKFGPQGGIADTATQLNTTPIPNFPEGLAFGKDGKLYLSRLTGNDIWEINPTNGAYVRTVATGLNQPLGIAVDPLSGDLFVNQNLSPDLLRIANPASASPAVTVYASPGDSDGLAIAPDGTFFSATFQTSNVTRIAGTNAPTPGAVTVVANVPNLDGIAVAVNAGVPAFLFVNRTDGIITKVDLTTAPPTTSDIFTGGSRGDFAAVGPDGCYYATQKDRVIKVTNADGTCPFAPTSVLPQLGLSPASVVPNPPTGSPVTFTATLRNVPSPAGIVVTFTVAGPNGQTKNVPADASGVATFTYTGAHTGSDTVTATAKPGATLLTSNPTIVTWAAGKDVTFIALNTSTRSGAANVPATLTASLTDVSQTPPTPISGASVTIAIGTQTCVATTGTNGIGSCAITPNEAPGSYPLVATYAGSAQYTASTITDTFTVGNLVPTSLAYTGPTTVSNGSSPRLTAVLTARSGGALSGKPVTLTLGGSATAQTCSGTTDNTGTVGCTITVAYQPRGPGPVAALFAGDGVDAASWGSATATTVGPTFFSVDASLYPVTPLSGGIGGGTTIRLVGDGFAGGTVTAGGVTCANPQPNPAGTILTCVTGAHAEGTVDVVITTPEGAATATGAFTYVTPGSLPPPGQRPGTGGSGNPTPVPGNRPGTGASGSPVPLPIGRGTNG